MNPFGAIREFEAGGTTYKIADLTVLEEQGLCDLDDLPVSIRILLESVLRNADGEDITEDDVRDIAGWQPDVPNADIPFQPSRVISKTSPVFPPSWTLPHSGLPSNVRTATQPSSSPRSPSIS
jgi:aconitase A